MTTLRLDVHHYIHHADDPATSAKLDLILSRLDALKAQETAMKADITARFDAMATEIGSLTDVVQGAETLLDFLANEVQALKSPTTDPETLAKLDELTSTIAARKAELAAKVVQDTPAAEPPAQG